MLKRRTASAGFSSQSGTINIININGDKNVGRNHYNKGNLANQYRKKNYLEYHNKKYVPNFNAHSNSLKNKGSKQEVNELNKILQIPSILNYGDNFLNQTGVEVLRKNVPHNNVLLLLNLTTLLTATQFNNGTSSIHNTILGSQNSLSTTVHPIEMSRHPIVLHSDAVTTSNSANHVKSKMLIKHSEKKLIKEHKASDQNNQTQLNGEQSLIRIKRAVDEENGYFKLPDGIHYVRELEDRLDFKNLLVKKYDTENGIDFFELLIWGSDIGCKEVKKIETMLKNMQRVNLSNNHISDDAASELGKIIGKNTHAIELILSNNNIGDLTVQAFVAALADSKNIIALSLEDNNITDTGARTLMLWLQKHPEIISFNLHNNDIQSNTLNEIARIIEQHQAINTDISIIKSATFQEDLTTTQENFTEKSELRIVNITDNTTTPEKTNSNDQASYNIMLVGLLVSTIVGISAAVYAIKRHFCKNTNSKELQTFDHNELALLEPLDLSHNTISVATDILNEVTDILGDIKEQ